MSTGKILSAFHEWDDRDQMFRVYLDREPTGPCDGNDDELPDAQPMETTMFGGSDEARIGSGSARVLTG